MNSEVLFNFSHFIGPSLLKRQVFGNIEVRKQVRNCKPRTRKSFRYSLHNIHVFPPRWPPYGEFAPGVRNSKTDVIIVPERTEQDIFEI